MRLIRVLVDTTFALRGPSGTGVYLERLIGALRALDVEVVEAKNEARRAPAGGPWRSALNAATDEWWTKRALPRRARESGADVLHHPLPAFALGAPAAQVVTVHDLAFARLPDGFDATYRRWASVAHKAAARRADAVICPSRTTAEDVRTRWGIEDDKVVIAPHGPGQEPHGELIRAQAPRHLLYVGDDEPRKNLPMLLRAYAAYRRASEGTALPLVLAGSARQGRGEAGVEIVDRPEPLRLAALYAQAAALVHPALHEGFGLTPLEAMTAGTPVVAAKSPGVTETCGDAALYVDPRSTDSLTRALLRVSSEKPLRQDLAERGRRRAAEFSWARSARRHVTAYEAAVERHRHASAKATPSAS